MVIISRTSISMIIVIFWWAHEWSHARLSALERNERFNCHNLLYNWTWHAEATRQPNLIVTRSNNIRNAWSTESKLAVFVLQLFVWAISTCTYFLASKSHSWRTHSCSDKGTRLSHVGLQPTRLPSVMVVAHKNQPRDEMSEIIQDWQYRCRRTQRMLIINEISWFYVTSFRQVVKPLFVCGNITRWETNTVFLRQKGA